jgi:hypothetical protein
VAVRDRGRHRNNRGQPHTGGLRQASRPHDDLAGLPRTKARQGRSRWSAAARHRGRPPVRCASPMVASASDAGIGAVTNVMDLKNHLARSRPAEFRHIAVRILSAQPATAVSFRRLPALCKKATFPRVSRQKSGLWPGSRTVAHTKHRFRRRVSARQVFNIRNLLA